MTEIVQTVTGPVSPNSLGHTLTHEHLSMDFRHFYRPPPQKIASHFNPSLNLSNVGFIRQYPYSSLNNLILNDGNSFHYVHDDLISFKNNGGGTIVENSTIGLQRDVNTYQRLSKETGVNIVAGTGYYIADMQTPHVLHSFKEELYERMLKDMTEGCEENQGIKAGFIGEVASVWPLRDFERRVIQSAGELQEQLGCGVSFHPHRTPDAPFEIIRLYLEAGGRAEKAVMSHLDRTLQDDGKLLEFSELGTYCQFDLFGIEVSYYQLNPDIDMPSDSQRLQKIKLLVEEGRTEKILMSHDIHTKHRLEQCGGHGFSHIINNVVPRMKSKGYSREDINKIIVENPASWLTIQAS